MRRTENVNIIPSAVQQFIIFIFHNLQHHYQRSSISVLALRNETETHCSALRNSSKFSVLSLPMTSKEFLIPLLLFEVFSFPPSNTLMNCFVSSGKLETSSRSKDRNPVSSDFWK